MASNDGWNNASKVHLKDESGDKTDYWQTPMVVYMLCPDTFTLTFWSVIRQICWVDEKSECYINTPDLAVLAMMSTGKAAQCRDFLIDAGLLIGRLEKANGSRTRAIWHLSIPWLWGMNKAMMPPYRDWKARLAYKREQMEEYRQKQRNSRDEKGKDEFSCGESSDLSAGEKSTQESSGGENSQSLSENDLSRSGENLSINIYTNKKKEVQIQNEIYDLWFAAIEELRSYLSPRDFSSYIVTANPIGWDEDTLVVCSMNAYNVDWLNQKAKPYLVRIIRPLTNNSKANIRFELGYK
jgi:hypothetical protein